MNYYNDFDPFICKWLEQLIENKLIPPGVVDNRSILDVQPSDLRGFTQHHFFAGIGGWSYALDLAGWPRDRPVCTASLPCQPFSVAGNNKGKEDERHLLPHFMELVRACKFDTIMGEQVEGAVRHGWLDDLQATMEAEGYTTGAVVLGAHSIGGFHQRQRIFWVANTISIGRSGWSERPQQSEVQGCRESEIETQRPGDTSTLGNTKSSGTREDKPWIRSECRDASKNDSTVGNSECHGLDDSEVGRSITESETESRMLEHQRPDTDNIWENIDFIYCRDGKYRPIPVEPSLFPLAHGLPNRVGILRGAGNSIVPQTAAQVIKAYMGVV